MKTSCRNQFANRPMKFFVLTLIGSLLIPAMALARSSLSNVGNWLGEYQGQEIEMSIWFDADELHVGYVRGYILNRNTRCATGLFGYRVMSDMTRFFSFINDPSLSDYGLEFETRVIDMNGLDTACRPLKFLDATNRLMFVYEPELGHASLATTGDPPKAENGFANVVRVMSLRRAAASATMQEIVAANPTIYLERGAQSRPSSSVQRLLENPDIDSASNIPVDEIPCRVLVREQDARASLLGIRDIASTMEPNNKLGIRYLQWPGPFIRWADEFSASPQERDLHYAPRQEQYLQVDASLFSDPAFLNLPNGSRGMRYRKEGCLQARMLDQFLTSLERGDFSSDDAQPAVGEAPPRIEDANAFFFFDDAGIDQIEHLSMMRIYGTTTLFVPGDVSREGLWSPKSQSMKLRAMVKHSRSAHIENDLLSKFNEASFVYNAELSKGAGSDVWVSVADRREGGLCTRWREKHFVDNCAERSTNDQHGEHVYYMTADLAAAKKIFHSISPNAIPLPGEDLADSTRGCERGAFCDLPGGLYLNAIYDGDFGTIQRLDEQIRIASENAVDELMPGDGLTDRLSLAFVPTSLLPYLAKRYMYQYKSASQNCFEPRHQVVVKEWIIPESYSPDTDYNGYVITGQKILGSKITASYDINPEFFALCDRVCDPMWPTGNTKWPSGNTTLLTDEGRTMNEGLDKVLFEHDCASPAVQQFERNLITLTEQAMNAGPQPFVERSSL